MGFQDKAILSLGSNSGNRHENIVACLNYIHTEIATVVKVSGLYETPSWGFESDDFYNCAALVHTSLTPAELLNAVLNAEVLAGRQRTAETGYQARLIDIDIIAYNDVVTDDGPLTLPHPRLQYRNFVLYPLRDVAPGWVHPVLNVTVEYMIAESPDKSSCEIVAALELPGEDYGLEKFNYIAIEGNIGAGKTTLASKIAEDFNARLVLERFADNPFLPKFYRDPARYALSLEMSFLADRYHQLNDDLAQFDLFSDFVVADYHIFKSLIFAKVTLTDDEYRLYNKLFDIMYKEMPKPGLYVYLHQDTDRLLEQIKMRGRDYEQGIKADYLNKINKGYLEYIKLQQGLNVIIIDISQRDFVKNQQDYHFILAEIKKALPA